jgi:hypothetical protein
MNIDELRPMLIDQVKYMACTHAHVNNVHFNLQLLAIYLSN